MTFVAPNIEVRNCQIVCEGRPLFASPLSVSFSPGRLNIISGPNGSGKSSLLDILALRTKINQTRTVVRLGHSHPKEIAYLPQTSAHVLDIKVKHLVDLAFRSVQDIPSAPLEIAPVLQYQNREVGELSGGEKQILLFWLVASQPLHVFIYDEPLRHLDDHAVGFVTRTIEQQVEGGELIILSDHSEGCRWACISHRLELTLGGQSR